MSGWGQFRVTLKRLWLWVPAFAGTTHSMTRSQIQISNSKYDFAISRRVAPELCH